MHWQQVEFDKALGVWALAVLKDAPTIDQRQDPCGTVLRPLEEAIEAKILSIPEGDAKPQAEEWSVSDLFTSLNNWVSSSSISTYDGDTYADWVELVNCGLWLLRNLEDEVETVDFRENTENILLQRDSGNYLQNGEIVSEGRHSTVFITQTTANTLHGSARQERRWFRIAKDLASSGISHQAVNAAGWCQGIALLRCEHRLAEVTTQEGDRRAALDGKPLTRPQTPIEQRAKDESSSRKKRLTLEELIERRKHGQDMAEDDAWRKVDELYYKMRPYRRARRHLRDRLNSHVSVTHAHSIILVGRELQLMYADRQGLILTTPIHVVHNFPTFLALLFILQRFSQKEWGKLPSLSRGVLRLDGINYDITRPRKFRRPHEIIGPHSWIVATSKGPLAGSRVVAKFSWQDKPTQDLEHNWLMKAWDALPEDRVHLLQCLGWKEYETATTRTIRESFGLDVNNPRRYYVVLLPHFSLVLRELPSRLWLTVFWDCFKVYFKLWKRGICRGSVTDTSMGLRLVKGGEKPWVGVWNDFDHASDTTNSDGNPEAAGSLFESRAGHAGKTRTWYDEVESFLWVGIYDNCIYETLPTDPAPTEKQLELRRCLYQWRYYNNRIIGAQKLFCLSKKEWEEYIPTEEHTENWPWIQKLAELVASEDTAQMEEQDLYDRIITDICEPSLKAWGPDLYNDRLSF
ncbi:hypothetical protein BDN72DRAFT_961578 [Pluteus cervinus]|uniref:Uncharacterized protein n=1 Tax=Pluteus cervinus TaxID=181527 RepID=A0ACD3AM13_9AGAR|nr:hypothetical protein BDN72DRAFT_961578 [Pluteus cervinus]